MPDDQFFKAEGVSASSASAAAALKHALSLEAVSDLDEGQAVWACLSLLGGFGSSVRILQYFTAFDHLVHQVEVVPTDGIDQWEMTLCLNPGPRARIILSKLQVLPFVLSMKLSRAAD